MSYRAFFVAVVLVALAAAAPAQQTVGPRFIVKWLNNTQHLPQLAYDSINEEALAVWQNDVPDIYARVVTGSGAIPAGPLHIRATAFGSEEPDVAADPLTQEYLVVWQERYGNVAGPFGVWGRRVRATQAMDPLFEIEAPPSDTYGSWNPALAWVGGGWIALWESAWGPPSVDIAGRVVWSLFGDGFDSDGTGARSAESFPNGPLVSCLGSPMCSSGRQRGSWQGATTQSWSDYLEESQRRQGPRWPARSATGFSKQDTKVIPP